MRLVFITLCLVCGLAIAYHAKQPPVTDGEAMETFGQATLTQGSTGADVRELQGRLKFLGYYNGKVDGDFGAATLASVKKFQASFGMKADGVVGAKTKLKLYNATKNWKPGAEPDSGGGTGPAASAKGAPKKLTTSSHRGYSSNDLKMMANAVYGEARGESYEGQVAVAAVILNRVDNPSFPDTPSGVIFQPGAFTAVADGQIWLTPNESALKAVQDALNGWDPTDGCLYYFNPETATSKWIWSRPQYKKIGKHIFCR